MQVADYFFYKIKNFINESSKSLLTPKVAKCFIFKNDKKIPLPHDKT